MTITCNEPFGPMYLRPAQAPCPNCPCCSALLCQKGAASAMQCYGHVNDPQLVPAVSACPCSADKTRGTHAWRLAQIRVVKHATEHPLPKTAETVLRALAGNELVEDPAGELCGLRSRGYVDGDETAWRITRLGRRYLSALDEPRYTSAVYVKSVDVATRTAKVVVIGWHMHKEVTVLADQLGNAVDLPLPKLPGLYLDAKVNLGVTDPDDLVLTRIQMPEQITEDDLAERSLPDIRPEVER
ncbi:hypothetical protein PV518_34835 [Streptomyces sp. ND04-05B]|uniref:hypothetical protein n=1 Tax=Streptomyces sp. ND04-05B TaxID=3028693 RepID=UPI0029A33637|nr:hypothetical protein [Streptomyces sp. ND04-05B]MDX3067290.1 hypothetical protein [Streptomyces sp. ND04-05B]